MTKLIAVVLLSAFALVPSLPAGDKCCDKDKPAEKGCCPAGKQKEGCPKEGGQKECPSKGKTPEKK